MKNKILSLLTTECPWRDTLYWYPQTDSTNTQAKLLAKNGAPQGTVLVAGNQTAGRGRMGRTFQSPDGQGVYLSVILHPGCSPTELMHLTCAVGAAMVNAVEAACGLRPQIKWINDLVVEGKKLGGILTELSFAKGCVDYAVVGVGINCLQTQEAFPEEIADIATSLSMVCRKPVQPEKLAAAMIEALWKMEKTLLTDKARWMADYKAGCVTLGKDIQVLRDGQVQPGRALDVDADGGLVVRYADGSVETVASGEVSVRGMYGYV